MVYYIFYDIVVKMGTRLYCYYLLTVISFSLSCNSRKGEIRDLFTDENDHWIKMGEATWSFDQEKLIGTANGSTGFVMTRDRFADFILELEFYPDNTVNSGVFIRCEEKVLSAVECYELNIWDQHPDQTARTGAVVQRSPPLNLVHTINRWNRYRIVCKENNISAWINDQQVVDLTDNSLSNGYIGLQVAESGSIRFRNIQLTCLEE